jgi:hypothetical protein
MPCSTALPRGGDAAVVAPSPGHRKTLDPESTAHSDRVAGAPAHVVKEASEAGWGARRKWSGPGLLG